MNLSANLRVAIVHHWFLQRGGAERVVEVLAEMFPQADLFTLLLDRHGLAPSLRGRSITPSFLQKWPGSRRWHRLLLPFYPLALESLDLSGYDLVISSESGPSKGVLTGADACHICYCHSPMRYLWEMPHYYRRQVPGGALGRAAFAIAGHYVRIWDLATASRVDHFVASSSNGARRIAKHYGRESAIIHPPVSVAAVPPPPARRDHGGYYLIVSRLVAYKRIDLAIAACNATGRRLVIIGGGEELGALRRLAGPTISFLGGQSDAQVGEHYALCRAFLFPGEEDIGLTPIEAQARGCPVVAFGRGGALETVLPPHPGRPIEDCTGVFFDAQTPESLIGALEEFEALEYRLSPLRIRAHAMQFDVSRFREAMFALVAERLNVPRSRAAAV